MVTEVIPGKLYKLVTDSRGTNRFLQVSLTNEIPSRKGAIRTLAWLSENQIFTAIKVVRSNVLRKTVVLHIATTHGVGYVEVNLHNVAKLT